MVVVAGCAKSPDTPSETSAPMEKPPEIKVDKKRPLDETVTIDLERDLGPVTHKASGFVRGMAVDSPPVELVAPLRPGLFVMPAGQSGGKYQASAIYERARHMGADVQAVLGRSVKFDGKYPGEKDNWSKWDQGVTQLVMGAKAAGQKIEWDIWSEPDRRESFNGSRDDYFRCWYHTVRLIRKLDPEAQIVGPSMSRYDGGWIEGFLKDCKDYEVLPDAVSWHENTGRADVTGHVNNLEENCWQDGFRLRRFTVNQYISKDHQFSTGVAVHFLADLERVRIDSSARAHFAEHGYQVGGLLTADVKPRAVWWVYRQYAQMTGERVKVSSSPTMNALAAYDAAGSKVTMLVGRDWARTGKKKEEMPPFGKGAIKLQHVPGEKVQLVASPIPNMGDKPVAELSQRLNMELAVDPVSHEISVELPDFANTSAYWVEIKLSAPVTLKHFPEDEPSAFDTRLKL